MMFICLAMQAFNDKCQRAKLFVDFIMHTGDLDKVMVEQTRRAVKKKLSACVYKPKTDKELMDRYNNRDYMST